MARFSLSSYTVRLRDKQSDTYLPLGNFGYSSDLLELLNDYLETRKSNYALNDSNQKLLRVATSSLRQRTIRGIIETGEYGYEAELYNVQTDATSYRRVSDDAEMMPFYFLANLPSSKDEGLLILQRRAQYGIRTVLLEDFRKYLKETGFKFKVEVNPLVPQVLVDQYLQNGRLRKVRFIRFEIPPDVADAFEGGGHLEETGYMELVVRAGRNRRLPVVDHIRNALNSGKNVNEMIELQHYDYDTIKVELDVGGSRKTIDLSDTMKLRAYYDISSEVEIGSDGHPVFASIDSIALDLMDRLLDALGTNGTNV